jgi:hypothetical protein
MLRVFEKYIPCLCVADQYFWQLKLEYDYNILHKKEYLSWFERYKLAWSAGSICIYDTERIKIFGFNLIKFECGNSDERILYGYMLDIRAINAFMTSYGLYYLTDEMEFYMIGYTDHGMANVEKKLIDYEVTNIIGSCSIIYYIKENDIYTHSYNCENQRLTFTQNVVQIMACLNEVSYVTFDGECH